MNPRPIAFAGAAPHRQSVSEPFITTAFEMGDDVAVLLPEEFGIEPGQEFEITKNGSVIVLSPVESSTTPAG